MKRWTKEEINILTRFYHIKTIINIQRLLSCRTIIAIHKKALKLKLSFHKTLKETFWKYVNKKEINECWNWIGASSKGGYGRFRINKNIISSHRFSWVIYNGDIPNDKLVLHKCNNPPCVNPNHLYLGTNKDNSEYMVKQNRYIKAQGEDNGRSKLILSQVKQIRKLKGILFQRIIAKKFNVSQSLISHIHNNKLWKDI